jgi:hypothetical protein
MLCGPGSVFVHCISIAPHSPPWGGASQRELPQGHGNTDPPPPEAMLDPPPPEAMLDPPPPEAMLDPPPPEAMPVRKKGVWGGCGEGGERGLYFTRCCEGQHGTTGVAIFVALAGADELGIP